MLICGVSFKNNGKVYNFSTNNIDVKEGDYVIVETEKGEQYGKVAFVEDKIVGKDLKNVLRVSTDIDYNKYLKSLKDAKDALECAKKMATDLNLEMQLVDASFTFDRKQLLINFIADDRVDFRELVKQLANKYKTRIELHQMGVRDKAKEIGGLGPCGRQLCCSAFLNKMDAVTITMAKNQNIALNPTKINGSCGRLLCCLNYEDDGYSQAKSKMPNIGAKMKKDNNLGTVVLVDVLRGIYKLDFNGDIKEYNINDK